MQAIPIQKNKERTVGGEGRYSPRGFRRRPRYREATGKRKEKGEKEGGGGGGEKTEASAWRSDGQVKSRGISKRVHPALEGS